MNWFYVTETYREQNEAYITFCKNGVITRDRVVRLDKIENHFGCKFDDGGHPRVKIEIENEEDFSWFFK